MCATFFTSKRIKLYILPTKVPQQHVTVSPVWELATLNHFQIMVVDSLKVMNKSFI